MTLLLWTPGCLLGASWLKSLYEYLEQNTALAENGFKAAGIIDLFTNS